MSEFYQIDSTKISHREYWWGNRSPLVLVGWLLKWLRVRIPGSTDDPPVDSIIPFQVTHLPEPIQNRIQAFEEEMLAIGFHSPIYHLISDIGTSTVVYWVTYLHESGQHFGRIHHRVWQQTKSSDRGVFAMIFTAVADDTFLVSSSGKPDLDTPVSVLMNRLPRASCHQLWTSHQTFVSSRLSKSSALPARSSEELLALTERHHGLIRDYLLDRGVFRTKTAQEKAEAEVVESRTTAAYLDGLENPGAIAELERLQGKKPSWSNTYLILGISLLGFLAAGATQWNWQFMLWLIPVLLFHELGHWVAMRVFRYRNLRMFFIPLFGAAVTGQNWNVPGWKKSLVYLAGPVPGILLGSVLAIAGIWTRNSHLNEAAQVMLILNGFNLLPVLPLDGGNVLLATLFCRNRWLDIVFRILAVVALVSLGILGFGKLLPYIAIPIGLALPIAFKLAKVTDTLREDPLPPMLPGHDFIPPTTADRIISQIKKEIPKPSSDNILAQHALSVFETLNARPPGIPATLAILTLHAGSFLVAAIMLFLLIIAKSSNGLGNFFEDAANQPVHSVSCGTIKELNIDEQMDLSTNSLRNLIVGTLRNESASADSFSRLRTNLPTSARLTLLGESIMLSIPASDDAAREHWYSELQQQTTNLFVVLTNRPVTMSFLAIAPNQQAASNLVEQIECYFNAPGNRNLLPPWAPAAQKAPFSQYTESRIAWSKIATEHRRIWEDPQMRSHHKLIAAATKRGAQSEVQRLQDQEAELIKASTEQLKQRLKEDPSLKANSELIPLYFRWTESSITNRVHSDELMRQIQSALGGISGTNSSDFALSARYGVTSQNGLFVQIRWLSLINPQKSAPALVEWFCTLGCSTIKYEFTDEHSLSDVLEQ